MIESQDWHDGMTMWRGAPRADDSHASGFAMRHSHNRAYWNAYFTRSSNTLWRDGNMAFDGKMWHSKTCDTVSYPYAVTDDYGALVAVRNPHG